MKNSTIICLVCFTIICIGFTVGYAYQPIINISSTIYQPLYVEVQDDLYSYKSVINGTEKQYKDFDYSWNNVTQSFTVMFALSIISSILIVFGIILAFINNKLISKLMFIFASIFMLLSVIIIIIINFVILPSHKDIGNSPQISCITSGNMMIMISTFLMLVFTLIYMKLV